MSIPENWHNLLMNINMFIPNQKADADARPPTCPKRMYIYISITTFKFIEVYPET